MKLRYLLLFCFSAAALGAEDTIITESTSTSDVNTTTEVRVTTPVSDYADNEYIQL